MSESRSSFSAYYWPTGQRININDKDGVPGALTIRNRSTDKRAGDCWCHEDCYNNGTGTRMYPYDYESGPSNTRNHFKRERGKTSRHPTRGRISTGGCTVKRRVKLLKEDGGSNNYYEQFFSDLKAELVGSSNMWDNIDKYYIQRVEFPPKNQRNASDLIIHHTPGGDREATHVVIVNMSYNRTLEENLYDATQGRTRLNTILIYIRRWTDEHISDFAGQGKRMFEEKWNDLERDSVIEKERLEREEKRRTEAQNALDNAMINLQNEVSKGERALEENSLNKLEEINHNRLSILWNSIRNASRFGIDTTPAEERLEAAKPIFARVQTEKSRLNREVEARRGHARDLTRRLEIIGITPPNYYTEYDDVIRLFEEHEGEILKAEDQARRDLEDLIRREEEEEEERKRREEEKREASERERRTLLAQGNSLLRELDTNRTSYQPSIEILNFASGNRIPGYYRPGGELPSGHILLLKEILTDSVYSSSLEKWAKYGYNWGEIGIVPYKWKKMIPSDEIELEPLLQKAREELDAILPIYREYFKSHEREMEARLRKGKENLDSAINTFEDNVNQLDSLSLNGVKQLLGPLEEALDKYTSLQGAKQTSAIRETRVLINNHKDRARSEDNLRTQEKKNRIEAERNSLEDLVSELEETYSTIEKTNGEYISLRDRIEKLQDIANNIVKSGDESIERIDNESKLASQHNQVEWSKNQSEISQSKDSIKKITEEYQSALDLMAEFYDQHLKPLWKTIENAANSLEESKLPTDYWNEETPDRKKDLETKIERLNHHKDAPGLLRDAKLFIDENQQNNPNLFSHHTFSPSIELREKGKINELESGATNLCDSRPRGTLQSKDVNYYGFIDISSRTSLSAEHRPYMSGKGIFVHGTSCIPDDSFHHIRIGCELRFEPTLETDRKGEIKLQAKNVTHYLCPNCENQPQSSSPASQVYLSPSKPAKPKPLSVGQKIKRKKQKKRAKKTPKQPTEELTGKNRPKKPKKGKRLPTTRGGPRKKD